MRIATKSVMSARLEYLFYFEIIIFSLDSGSRISSSEVHSSNEHSAWNEQSFCEIISLFNEMVRLISERTSPSNSAILFKRKPSWQFRAIHLDLRA